jgi:SAM-dependent methyltransferase
VSAAGDFDYDTNEPQYARRRQTDTRIARVIHAALGDARTVLNVGAGAGSYEPTDRHVLAIEPSAAMRAQRPRQLAPAIQATADALPFDDDAVDAAMAVLTVHHWPDLERGLREMRRVARERVLIVSADPDALDRFWLADYAPEMIAVERRRYPTLDTVARALAGRIEIQPLPIPIDCVDGFSEAFYARPEAFLDDAVRRSQSAWGFVDVAVQRRMVERLRTDLASGEWDRRYGSWRTPTTFDGSMRLLVAHRA